MRCSFMPPASPSSPFSFSGFRLTRNLKSSSSSESPLGSSTVILTRAELVALPGTSKKLFIVSGRQPNSIRKLTVSASLISPSSSHMTPAASRSPTVSNCSGSPHMYSPVHFVDSFTHAARQAWAYILMLRSGISAWSQTSPLTACKPRGAPSAKTQAAAARKCANPSGEKMPSCMVAEACDTRSTSLPQRPSNAWWRRPRWQSVSSVGAGLGLGLGARSIGRSPVATG
mmetsp:Transcript_100984/g.290498  ORF Transcript_100984/g.290498 Transcript_100984/m.290498 type:complete len:229 (-) Transcript_100984:1562-2248(-)